MTDSDESDVTGLLQAWSDGDPSALDRLTALVYDRLRRLAASFLRQEREDHTLQTTALIHEAYLRLIEQDRIRYRNREQFFVNAAHMMRRVLVDHARARVASKRGGDAERMPIDTLWHHPSPQTPLELISLDVALSDLEKADARLARIVELKFFVDLTAEEIGAVLGLGSATVQRRWRLARAWLRRELVPASGGP